MDLPVRFWELEQLPTARAEFLFALFAPLTSPVIFYLLVTLVTALSTEALYSYLRDCHGNTVACLRSTHSRTVWCNQISGR